MRYYDFDENRSVRGSYACPQPGMNLELLEDAPDDESKHIDGKWVPDQDKIDAKQAIQDAADVYALIEAKMREQAITALQTEGKLTKEGKAAKA